MVRRITHLVTAVAVAVAILTAAPAAQAIVDKDCGDFATQAGAQKFFLNNGGPNNDPHQLDADGDGVACESNPCPCNTSTGGGGGDADGDGGTKTVRQKAKIVRVVDGDTVNVNLMPGPKRSVRLIGIDTPEVYGGVECGGKAASAKTKKLLPQGTIVRLVSDPTQDLKDRYDRLLRYVSKGTVDINRRLVWTGNAKVYVYNNNPFKRVKSYRAAQADAKDHSRGIWGNC